MVSVMRKSLERMGVCTDARPEEHFVHCERSVGDSEDDRIVYGFN